MYGKRRERRQKGLQGCIHFDCGDDPRGESAPLRQSLCASCVLASPSLRLPSCCASLSPNESSGTRTSLSPGRRGTAASSGVSGHSSLAGPDARRREREGRGRGEAGEVQGRALSRRRLSPLVSASPRRPLTRCPSSRSSIPSVPSAGRASTRPRRWSPAATNGTSSASSAVSPSSSLALHSILCLTSQENIFHSFFFYQREEGEGCGRRSRLRLASSSLTVSACANNTSY